MNSEQLIGTEEMIRENADMGNGQFAIDEFKENGRCLIIIIWVMISI